MTANLKPLTVTFVGSEVSNLGSTGSRPAGRAIKVVKDPDLHRDTGSLGFIKNLAIDRGRVAFTIELTMPACPANSG